MTGQWLRETRERLGLSVEELSERTNIREEVLREWEASRVDPELAEWFDLLLWTVERDAELYGHGACDFEIDASDAEKPPDEEVVAKHVAKCDFCRARLAIVRKNVRWMPVESTPLPVAVVVGIAAIFLLAAPGFLSLLIKGVRGEAAGALREAGALSLLCLVGGITGGVGGWFASPLWRYGFFGRWCTITAGFAGYFFGVIGYVWLGTKWGWETGPAKSFTADVSTFLAVTVVALIFGLLGAWQTKPALGTELFARAEQ